MTLKRFRLAVLFGCAWVLASGCAFAQSVKSENLFYMTDTMDALQGFKAHASQISIIVPAAYHVDKYGTVYGGVDPRVLQIAASNHVEVMPIVASFDQDGIHAFLSDPKARARAIDIMLYDAQHYHYYGWQFDLENIHVADGEAYTDFYREAAKALHARGFRISMAVIKAEQPVPAQDDSGFSKFLYENWKGAFDFKKLAAIGDFMSFMSYDQNTALTPPGPVAGVPWMQRMADYLMRLGIDPHKVSFGIPTYSDHWYAAWSDKKGPHSTRDEITWREAQDLLDRHQVTPQWMQSMGVDYAYWPGPNGVFEWLFIENARSFSEKLKLVRQYHFRGFSAWVLGFEDPKIWDVLKQQTQAIHYQGGTTRP